MRTLIALLVLAQPCLAQFEGAMSIRNTATGPSGPVVVMFDFLMKNDKAAGTFQGDDARSKGRFIFQGDKKLVWIINDDEKSYMEFSTAAPAGGKKSPPKGPGLKKTGKHETLIGYPCDEYLWTGDDEERHIWATAKLGALYEGISQSLKGIGGGREAEEGTWERELAAKKLVPLLVETIRDGKTAERLEVVKIEEKPVPATAFAAPTGYTKHNLSDGINEMYRQMGKEGRKMKGKDFPGMNEEMEKMLKQMKEHGGEGEKEEADSSDDDDDD